MALTTETIADMVAYWHNGRPVLYRQITTEALLSEAVRYFSAEARAELSRRGIDWTRIAAGLGCRG
jgi:hypothetical protein